MAVRKRVWRNSDGSQGEAWIAEYSDRGGKPHIKTFRRKRDAEAYHAMVNINVRAGVHVPDSESITVAEAGRLWLATCEDNRLERSTLHYYRQHLELHIMPLLGAIKLSQLSVPMVRKFEDDLRKDRSPAMVRKAIGSLGAILADAQDRGKVVHNVVAGFRLKRRGKQARADSRERRLQVGVDIPAPDEIRALIPHLKPRSRALLLTAIFSGLRSSELRGLAWADVDFKRGELHVRQRCDCFGKIGRLKSKTATRSVPLPPMVVNALREHRLACPKGEHDLVFANGAGNVESHTNIINRDLIPAMLAAGLVTKSGKAKYTGLHALRHFYASWCINRRVDGGLELPLKLVSERLGHSTVQLTADTYGHLFPRGDDGAELAAAEKAFLG
jgi:integrase